jgi:hypothetical protein
MSEPRVIKDLNVVEIQKYQQNRHPILFIDYVDEIVVGKLKATSISRSMSGFSPLIFKMTQTYLVSYR